ncbi:D-alanyl-D-alanine carboxypeptidase family protein [Virgibacillus byunsanensis]|uniref:D-alanyl-D-alanine carboxypeptidase family protein n=1 Tax=Virgibacillus byunsanensis TaxID=570945 RepID=A0ABW3LIQ0_9BACI
MFKNSLTIALALVAIAFLVTACNTEEDPETKPPEKKEDDTTIPDSKEPEEKEEIIVEAPDSNLQKKDEGKSVQLLQEALNEIGYSITADGVYEETTTWAITDFQLQYEELQVTGVYNKKTRKALDETISGNGDIEPGLGLPQAKETSTTDEGAAILNNPYDQLALVNKENALPSDYIPSDLVYPNVRFPFPDEIPKRQMRQVAADALERMFDAADQDGLDLFAQSGYRSYNTQDSIFASNARQYGEEAANNFSARPGESEHQTGLTMDITSPDVNYELIVEFGETDEGKWVKEHAAEYGFIIRFLEGKEDITQYQYEPWHLRFVGEKAATEMAEKGITLEEYLVN